ncbi:MAG TPA: insulinase family protein [Gemmatimonadaceae bacterium]|nr:insulinase family protein [Gemmatimonadaceae bacterium]
MRRFPSFSLPSRRVLLAALLLPVAGLLPTGSAGAQSDLIPLDTAVRTGTLPNGLRYYIRHNNRPEKRLELRLVINAGSVLEDDDQKGLAHFTEHMLFNGTRRFAKNDIVSYLESIGVRFGADLNAYTGFDETVYILPVPTDKPGLVERSFDVLEDWAGGALFDSTEVVKERGVVLEEWRGGLGAGARVRDKQFPVLFHGSRYATRLPIGDTTVLKGANPGPLKRFYRDWYRPNNMAVVAVGDYDPALLEKLIRERFGRLTNPSTPRQRTLATVPGHDSTLVTIVTDPEEQVSSIQVIYKHPPAPLSRQSDYRLMLARRLYNQMLNSRLNEITRQPDAPFAFASSSYGGFVRGSDVYFLSATVKDGGIQRGLEAILREARRVDQHGFLPAELDRAKASQLRALESAYQEREKSESGNYAAEYINHFLTAEPTPGIAWEYETAKRVLPTVTLQDVNSLGRQWITEVNRVLAVSAPTGPNAAVPTAGELLNTFRKVDGETMTAWTESVSDAPLIATPPAKGRVVTEAKIPELNVTDWKLSNGVRVVVKPTDFKADEVIIQAYSPGGTSLVADADFVEGSLATLAVGRGGVATFDAIELGKKLAGKRAGVNFAIGNLNESISAGGSPKDIETILQLIYLKAVAPRRDEAAFNALRAQYVPLLANRDKDPEQVFGDTVVITMQQNHPRAQPLSSAMLQNMRYDRAFEIYKDRFADASDFTFVIVGAVNVDSLKPMVEQWLGALPSTGRKETFKDVGLKNPTTVIEKTVRKGVEPKAQTLVLFTGETTFDAASRYAMRSMGELLEMKLLENLREALGGTYSVSARGSLSKYPKAEYQFEIQFGSAPDKADLLWKTVTAVIDSVKQNGATAAELQKVREQQLRAQEVSLKENGYWVGNIAARLENGEDPRGLATYTKDFIEKLTSEQIRDAARRYLDMSRYAKFVLLPERVVP